MADVTHAEPETHGTEPMRTGPVLVPPTDIIEKPDAFLMIMDVPGADPDTIDITLDQNVLNISARSFPISHEGYAPLYTEYRDGSYERSFIVSERIDGDHIDAELRDGVLRITLPKAPQAQAKKVSVKLH